MPTTLTFKGQVTIPKQVRDALNLKPGALIDFAVNADGDVVLQQAKRAAARKPDRFEAVRGAADIKWRTQDLMAFLR